jgi:predicted dehydrogenase
MKNNVVLIGAGGRANAYLMYGAKEEYNLLAIVDPNAANRKTFLGLNSLVGMVKEYDDFESMIAGTKEKIDGVIITTPNHLHLIPAIECMKRGVVLALEKPIAENIESCKKILKAKRKYNGRVLVGFVLRSCPFYKKAKEWVTAGRIGEITTIQADEIPAVLTTSVMFRSDWKRFKKSSGGAMNEKCSHDIDMFNWLIGSAPSSIYSVAGCKSLVPDKNLPLKCKDCSITAKCAYYLPDSVYNHPDMIKKANDGLLYKFTRDNSSCIYNNGHDMYDYQQSIISYANGATVSLTLDFAAAGKPCGRHIKIIGTKGVIWGKQEDNKISIQGKFTDAVETVDITDDGSGHGGGDRNHADEFIRMMREPGYNPEATIEAGYLSSAICFAADMSVEKKKPISLNEYVKYGLKGAAPFKY